jgi:hypothetical protein
MVLGLSMRTAAAVRSAHRLYLNDGASVFLVSRNKTNE